MNQQRATSGFHPVNIAHLVMGLVLLGGVGVWALIEGGVVAHDDLRWLLPVPWVLGGGIGLLAAALTGPRRYAVQQSGWVGVSGGTEEPAAPEATEATQATTLPEDQPEPEPDDQEQP